MTYAEPWDDERLWIVSRGRLLAIDLCAGAPRPVRLAESVERAGRARPPDAEKEMMLAGLDEGDWDDRVIEDFREDEGFTDEPRRRLDASRNVGGAGPVRLLERRGDALAVSREREDWLCRPAWAVCTVRARAGTSGRQPGPTPAKDDVIIERPSAHGRWLVSAEGVWFSPHEGRDLAALCVELGRPFEAVPVQIFGRTSSWRTWRWLPEVTLLGARRSVTWGDGRRRSEVLWMLLLSFPGGTGFSAVRDDIAEAFR